VIFAGFPSPITWVIDKVAGFVGGIATDAFQVLIGGLTAWVIDAVVWVVNGVFHFFLDATDPNVQADWFVGRHGPYAATAAIGATLLVAFTLFGIVQGVLAGDVGGMFRQMALHVPVAVIGMVGLVTATQLLVALTDALSRSVLTRFEEDVHGFERVVGSLSMLSGGPATAFVVFVLGLVAVLAGLVLVAELVVRSALVYIVVALAPLVFAAQVWPALRGAGRRMLELLVALIVSKLVIAVGLTVAAAAIVGTGSGGEVTSLRPPEVVAEDPGGSVTQAVGILLAAVAAFGVSAFSPLLLTKLLPITEAALVAQGVRGGPLRAGQTAMSMTSYGRAVGAHSRVAAGPIAGAGAGAGGGAVAGVAGPAAVAGTAASVTKSVATRAIRQPSASGPARPADHSEGGTDDGR
jgi:hypothetical protein